MKTLDVYLFRRYVKATIASLAVLVLCFIIFEFIERSRLLLGERAGFGPALWFIVLRLPQLAGMVLPVSTVMGMALVNARMGRTMELTALASIGLGWRRLLGPAAVCAVAVTLLAWLNGEVLCPPAAALEEKLQQQVFGWMDAAWRYYAKKNWFRAEGGRLYQKIETGQGEKKRLQLHFYQLDDNFHLLRRVHLNDAEWMGTGWRGSSSLEWEFHSEGLKSFSQKQQPFYPWPEDPDTLSSSPGTPRAFGIRRLMEVSRKLESRGFNALAYRLEAHQRICYPLCGLLLTLAAFPWQINVRRRMAPARALLEVLGMIAAAYLLLATGNVLASNLNEPAGIWLAPAVLAVATAVSWIRKWKD